MPVNTLKTKFQESENSTPSINWLTNANISLLI